MSREKARARALARAQKEERRRFETSPASIDWKRARRAIKQWAKRSARI